MMVRIDIDLFFYETETLTTHLGDIMNKVRIGQAVPSLPVSVWTQGEPIDLATQRGRVILIEVFQLNCPGCFLYGLPQAITMHRKYSDKGLTVIGISTAFEDFDKNTLDNLRLLVNRQLVIGQTYRVLAEHDLLDDGRLSYRIPFPLAMDRLIERQSNRTEDEINDFIQSRIPDFEQQNPQQREQIRRNVAFYFEGLKYRAETFELFDLQGTPSSILIDKKGNLSECQFGHDPELEFRIQKLLEE